MKDTKTDISKCWDLIKTKNKTNQILAFDLMTGIFGSKEEALKHIVNNICTHIDIHLNRWYKVHISSKLIIELNSYPDGYIDIRLLKPSKLDLFQYPLCSLYSKENNNIGKNDLYRFMEGVNKYL